MCYSGRCKYEDYMGGCINWVGAACPIEEEEDPYQTLEYCVYYGEHYQEVYNRVKNLSNNDYDINKAVDKEIALTYIRDTIQKETLNFEFK